MNTAKLANLKVGDEVLVSFCIERITTDKNGTEIYLTKNWDNGMILNAPPVNINKIIHSGNKLIIRKGE